MNVHQVPYGVPRSLLLIDTLYSSPYWLMLSVDPKAALKSLDDVLRGVWLECCGHLSSFLIDGTEIEMRWDDDATVSGKKGSSSRKGSLQSILSPGRSFQYIYDYGSTTELRLKVGDLIRMQDSGEEVTVLGMNNPPAWSCSECVKPAVCHYSENDDDTVFCKECSEDPIIDECYLLPITNSPRTGICAFEDGWYDNE